MAMFINFINHSAVPLKHLQPLHVTLKSNKTRNQTEELLCKKWVINEDVALGKLQNFTT
jgi:hypothetical protein